MNDRKFTPQDKATSPAPATPTKPTSTQGSPLPGAALVAGTAVAAVQDGSQKALVGVPKARDNKAVLAALIGEARLSGPRFYYQWSVRTKSGRIETIQGPSIRLALAAARYWGGIDIQLRIEEDLPDAWVLKAVATDLIYGFSIAVLFRQAKSVAGAAGMGMERGLDLAFQIGQSKAARNALTRLLPDWLIQKALQAAMHGAVAAAAGAPEDHDVAPSAPATDEAIAAIMSALAARGVTAEMVQSRYGTGRLTAGMVAELEGIVTALDEGQTTIGNEFPQTPATTVLDSSHGAKSTATTNGDAEYQRAIRRRQSQVLAVATALGVDRNSVPEIAASCGVAWDSLTEDGLKTLLDHLEN